MFNVVIDYLPESDEVEVVKETTGEAAAAIDQVVSAEEILSYQRLVRKVPANQEIVQYAVRLARTSRPGNSNSPDFVNQWVTYGASLRAAQYMVLGGKGSGADEGKICGVCR